MNINTEEYWDRRFESGNWERKGGRSQTTNFALSQISKFQISANFDGTLIDFGCGTGDAIPIYHSRFKKARLIGIDISSKAIQKCKIRYSGIASFIHGNHLKVPRADIIICSNVLEHLTDDLDVLSSLLGKCDNLYIVVPYKEKITPGTEHVNSYDEFSFTGIGKYDYKIFPSKGWSQHGIQLYWNIYIKNIIRGFIKKQIISRNMQIMFHFKQPTIDTTT